MAALVPTSWLAAPFVGDDYVFLDSTRDASFLSLWSRSHTAFGWYRPWSRDLHYWALQHLAGPEPVPFRLASVALWVTAVLLFASLVRRILGNWPALFAALGVSVLATWSATMVWIAGTQDLWMLVWALAALHLAHRGRYFLACVPYALALLSKETAATEPVVIFALAVFVHRHGWRKSVLLVSPIVLLTIAWFFFHPVLSHRLWAHTATYGSEAHSPAHEVLWKSLLCVVNLGWSPASIDPAAFNAIQTVALCALVAGLAFVGTTRIPRQSPSAHLRDTFGFGAVWCAVGWLPLLTPSIGWHPYYASWGLLGAWFAISVFADQLRRAAPLILMALALARGAAAATRSWDWGSEWYQRRAANMLETIRSQLLGLHPELEPHTRVYFGSIPNNIGLIAGDSPALRVWYRDSTITAGYYSSYAPRGAAASPGPDLFFHFDSTMGLAEVKTSPETPPSDPSQREAWSTNLESLASALMRQGSPALAAAQFEKLAQMPERPDALLKAAVCWERVGEKARADALVEATIARTGASKSDVRAYYLKLRQSVESH